MDSLALSSFSILRNFKVVSGSSEITGSKSEVKVKLPVSI